MRVVVKIIFKWNSLLYNFQKIYRFLPFFMMSFMIYEVFSRHVLGKPTIWSYELTGMLMGPFWMMATSLGVIYKRQIKLELIYKRFPMRVQAAVDLILWPFFFYYVGLVCYYGFTETMFAFENKIVSKSFWAPLYWPWQMWIPIGTGLLLISGLGRYIGIIYKLITAKELEGVLPIEEVSLISRTDAGRSTETLAEQH